MSIGEPRHGSEALTAEKGVSATPLPHVNALLLIPQFPLDDVRVKLELDPERV